MNALALTIATGMLAVAPAPVARYSPLDPAELILQADLIVAGTITSVDATFTIRVDEVIAGKADEAELEVLRFEDWMCAQRYAPYEPGQRAIFHLQFQRGDTGTVFRDYPLQVMGAGNEGESPLHGTMSFHRAHSFKGDTRERHQIGKHEFVGLAVPEAEYTQAARALLRCYTWTRKPGGRFFHLGVGLKQTCSDAALETYRTSSKTAGQLLSAIDWHLRLRDR